MFHTPKFAILAAALSALALAAQAQDDAVVFRSDSRLVVLHATVLDSDGRLVTDLPQSAFHVYENGAAQDLKVFRREDAPVSIGLVIDDSGSMTNKRQKVAAAALALVEASHPDDEVFVIHFNEKTYLDTDFTHERAKLEQGLKTFQTHGTTAMRDAVRLGIEHLLQRAHEDKKVLIVITDGEDNESRVTRDYVVKSAQQSGVLVYGVGILSEINDDETQRAKRELDALTQTTGGRSYYLNDVSEATATAEEIARTIRNQYTLAYSPTHPELDGTFRRIELTVDRPQLAVITRSGYWATSTATASNRGPDR
ncbi:MAG: VWA domain-containing protein [Acidobacteriota bacterium]